jgi:hypothetical protein
VILERACDFQNMIAAGLIVVAADDDIGTAEDRA